MQQIQPQSPSNAIAGWGRRESGRSILANGHHRQMLDNFRQLSREQSSQGYHALALVNAVDSLRAAASPLNSMAHPRSASRRLLVAGGFEIEYELNSYYGDNQTDIEIVDIRIVGEEAQEDARPALWWAKKFNSDKGEWTIEEEPCPRLKPIPGQSGDSDKSPIKIGINGPSKNRFRAARLLGSHIPRGDKAKQTELEKQGFQFLYVPSGGAAAEGWRFLSTLGQGGSDQQRLAARILAGQMYQAHQQGLHVEWTGHSSGSWVLSEAMDHLAQRNIDLQQRQRVFLSDHTSSHFTADRRRRALNMNTDDDKWQNAAPGLPQVVGGLNLGAASLLAGGNQLIRHTPADERPGKAVALALNGATDGRRAWIIGGAAAGLMSSGISWALALAGINMLVASLPGAKDSYYQNTPKQAEQWVNRLFKRRQGG